MLRRLRLPRRLPIPANSITIPNSLAIPIIAALKRLELSFDINLTLRRLRAFYLEGDEVGRRRANADGNGSGKRRGTAGCHWVPITVEYFLLFLLAIPCLYIIPVHYLLKLPVLPLYGLLLLLPITSQFFFPATPILSWVLLYFSSRFIPATIRPHIWVSVLPTLETVLYGANISDILTRYESTPSPLLDIIAWLPYGLLHFALPFIVAAILFFFGSKPGIVKVYARAFGYLNLIGVMIQILIPCSPPWYELIHGLTPADYSMKGSPGGLGRIDALFNSNGYTVTFSNSPVIFGAFPSLHSGCATMEALFMSHFFPQGRVFYWTYAATLYWATMHLSHHYMIDVTAGASLAVIFFYYNITHHPALNSPSGPKRFVSSSSTSSLTTPTSDEEMGMMSLFKGKKKHAKVVSGLRDGDVPHSAVPFLRDHDGIESEYGDVSIPNTPRTPWGDFKGGKVVIDEEAYAPR
ncbi:PAP2-domain-containing protein [Atractiella rhizophila]|nr:PAP2-domain-containing protein [Atractiella rhizophila]